MKPQGPQKFFLPIPVSLYTQVGPFAEICTDWHDLYFSVMQTSAVKVANISFMHIKGTSATEAALKFDCSDYSPCENLYLEDIRLVAYNGESSKSFCWEAYGSSLAPVYPPPCFSGSQSYIQPKVISNSLQSF